MFVTQRYNKIENDKIISLYDEYETDPGSNWNYFINQAENFFDSLATAHWEEWNEWLPIIKNKINSMNLEELKDKRIEDIFELCGMLEEYKLTPKRKSIEQKINKLNEDF